MLVHDCLRTNARKMPDKTALIHSRQEYSYRDVDELSDNLSSALTRAGIQRRDRVLIFAENSPESVISIYGILKAGATFVMPNAGMKAKKLHYILLDSGSKILITHINKARVVFEAIEDNAYLDLIIWCHGKTVPPALQKKLETLSVKSSFWLDAIRKPSKFSYLAHPEPLDVDLATIIYTSGSTSQPKGVMSTHQNVMAAAGSIIKYLKNHENDIILDALPLSFDYGLYQVIMTFLFGGTVVLEKSFVYPFQVLELIKEYKVTGFPIVPTMLALIYEMEDPSKLDFESLRYISNTAAALPPAYIRKFMEFWPHVTIYSMYGLTECKRVSYVPPDKLDQKIDSVGIPMPNCETFVVDENGDEVGPGMIGELVVRGANVMQGYWNAPEETAKVFKKGNYPADRRLYTGDLFKKDEDGFLYFVARKDDLIKTKGERVSPREIENAICDMPGVSSVAVVGIPDKISGQLIRATLVAANENLTKKQIISYCQANLEPFMIPQHVEFRDDLPKLSNGKIDRKKLVRTGEQRRSNPDRRNMDADIAMLHLMERRLAGDRRSGLENRKQ